MGFHLGPGGNKWSELALGGTNGRRRAAGEELRQWACLTCLSFLVRGPEGRRRGGPRREWQGFPVRKSLLVVMDNDREGHIGTGRLRTGSLATCPGQECRRAAELQPSLLVPVVLGGTRQADRAPWRTGALLGWPSEQIKDTCVTSPTWPAAWSGHTGREDVSPAASWTSATGLSARKALGVLPV